MALPPGPSTASVTAHAWLHPTGMEGAPSDSPEPKTVLRTQQALNKGLLSGPSTGRGTGRAGAQLPEGHSLPLPSDSVEQTGCHAGCVGRASVQGPAETGPVTGSAVVTPCRAWRGRPRQARRGHRLPPEGDAGQWCMQSRQRVGLAQNHRTRNAPPGARGKRADWDPEDTRWEAKRCEAEREYSTRNGQGWAGRVRAAGQTRGEGVRGGAERAPQVPGSEGAGHQVQTPGGDRATEGEWER